MSNDIELKIKEVLETVRPHLQADGGDVEFIAFNSNTGVLEVSLIGMCAHCPMSQITLKQGIESQIVSQIPEVKEVRSI